MFQIQLAFQLTMLQSMPLVLVQWFFSSQHIIESIEMDVIHPELQRWILTCLPLIRQILAFINHYYRVLDSMAPQELCSSTLKSIVEGSSIECLHFQPLCLKTHSSFENQGRWIFKFSLWRVQDCCFPSMSTLSGKILLKMPFIA